MKFLVYITSDGRLDFRSEYNGHRFNDFLKKHGVNTLFELSPKQKVTPEARGYFEGALVPAYCDWAEGLNPLVEDDILAVREMLKREFNGRWVVNLQGRAEKVAKSTKGLSRQEFRESFIQQIVDYFERNQIPVPNPDLYKKWRDQYFHKEPELTFWQWLRKHKMACDGTTIDLPGEVKKIKREARKRALDE